MNVVKDEKSELKNNEMPELTEHELQLRENLRIVEEKKDAALAEINPILQKLNQELNETLYSEIRVDGKALPKLPHGIIRYFQKTSFVIARNLFATNPNNPTPIDARFLKRLRNLKVIEINFFEIGVILKCLEYAVVKEWGVSDSKAEDDLILLQDISEIYFPYAEQENAILTLKYNELKAEYDQITWDKINN